MERCEHAHQFFPAQGSLAPLVLGNPASIDASLCREVVLTHSDGDAKDSRPNPLFQPL
jgi:hypothetical protein